jgi:subtilisin family serine protease
MVFRIAGRAAALAFGLVIALGVDAAPPQAGSYDVKKVHAARMPVGISQQDTTVMLQLPDEPVAVVQGKAGRKLSRAEKDSVKGKLKGKQDALHADITRLGGTVTGKYQAAYNGIKVRIARNKVGDLASLPGVVAVRPLSIVRPSNTRGIPLIGAPTVWAGPPGLHGEGIKIAIIDTGIDYTHANFGGPGKPEDYTKAHKKETKPADPKWFGPNAPRVKGGYDFVGDSYDADPESDTYQPNPHPDPNPLDCDGHGSHVAGTAAGSGVTSNGKQYPGPYNATTVSGQTWNVGPGVAPMADLYALRVFGCNGSTDIVVDAIEWAVDHDMDVINMSLGSPFGTKDSPDAVASNNAAKAGIIVVTSAGNEGPNPYMVGAPSTAEGAISVAANDPVDIVPGATMAIPSGPTLNLQNSNKGAFANGTQLKVIVLKDGNGDVSLGCDAAEYTNTAGLLVIVRRGDCDRVARPGFGQDAGSAAVLMITNGPGYPPIEGDIPDVTIPFFGALIDDTDALVAADGKLVTLTNAPVPNPLFTGFASFSSGGARTGDSGLKPDITAPGVSITSTGMGTGSGGAIISGTSMASPHVAGVAALVRQAHPTWSVADLKAAIVNTGLPAGVGSIVSPYQTREGGTGFVQPVQAVNTQVTAHPEGGQFQVSLDYGFAEMNADFTKSLVVTLRNNAGTPAEFNVVHMYPAPPIAGRPHTITLDKTEVTVQAHSTADVKVTLDVPVGTVGSSDPSLTDVTYKEVAGLIQFTPKTASDNANVTLRTAYYFVPRALSNVNTTIGQLKGKNPTTDADVTNVNAVRTGTADFYAWGIAADTHKKAGPSTPQGSHTIRGVGVQSFDNGDGTQYIVFAINTFKRWSNASVNEFDIYVDVDGDGKDDYVIVAADDGLITAGDPNGLLRTFVYDLRDKKMKEEPSTIGLATAPTDSSTALLPIDSSQLCVEKRPCLSSKNPRFTYHVVGNDLINGGVDEPKGTAKYNPWNSSISQGGFAVVDPNGSDTIPIVVKSDEFKKTPALGIMVVTFDNASGAGEAQLIPVDIKK